MQSLGDVLASKRRHGYRMLDSIFGNHDVAVDPRDRVEDAQRWGVGIALSLGTRSGLLGHLKAHSLPALEGTCQPSRGARRAGPGVFGSIAGTFNRLRNPVNADGHTKDAAHGPLDVRA